MNLIELSLLIVMEKYEKISECQLSTKKKRGAGLLVKCNKIRATH